MIDQLCEAFFQAVQDGAAAEARVVKPYRAPNSGDLHQFVLFVKPEATNIESGVDLAAVLNLIFETLNRFQVEIGAAQVLNGPTLKQHQIMDRHYGVINAISKGGAEAISAGAKSVLKEKLGDAIAAGATVLGGHQFLEVQPEFSALALSTINDNIGTTKLAGGTYALSINVLGRPYIILNPFHPYQLVPFTSAGKAILVMEGRSQTSWSDLRDKLTGATNPADATDGSIRQQFLARQTELGLPSVTQGTNGIHLSAGPLEGMAEVQRFFADLSTGAPLAATETAFGQLLAAHGISAERVVKLAGNCNLSVDGEEISAFDLTEEMDAELSAKKLAACL